MTKKAKPEHGKIGQCLVSQQRLPITPKYLVHIWLIVVVALVVDFQRSFSHLGFCFVLVSIHQNLVSSLG